MNIEHLKTFHCVAKNGNFTHAARELFLTQPAVSMQIQNLEHSLRVVLFDRSRRRIELTSEGEVLYSYTKKIFGIVREMQNEFSRLNELEVGHLKLGATTIMGAYYLPQYLTQFFRRYPKIQFNFNVNNSRVIAELVYQRKVELGFAGSSSVYPGLKQHFLHREPLVIVAGKDFFLKQAVNPMTADEIVGATFIMREQGTRVTQKITEWFKQNTQLGTAPSLITVDNMVATKQLVINGFGITCLPRHAVSAEIAAKQLVPIYLQGFDEHVDYFLIYMPEQRLSHVAQTFLLYLFEKGLPLPDDLCKCFA